MEALSKAQQVAMSVAAIRGGPRILRLSMEICAKCGTCAKVCHVALADPDRRTNPAARSDHLRRVYKAQASIRGRLWARLTARDSAPDDGELLSWVRDFYECSGCRRCARFCPMGIDNSVITRKGRAILHSVGLTPTKIAETMRISDETGNDEGQGKAAFLEAVRFLEEEMKEETGVNIPIPVDVQGADILFVPASADLISFPDTQIGSSKILFSSGESWTMSSEAFDAANFGLFSGDDAHMKRKCGLIHHAAVKLGVKKVVIGECGHAYRVMKMAPKFFGEVPYEITSILEMTADLIRVGRLDLDPSKNPDPVTYHDPCNFARSLGVIEEPREVLRAVCRDFREMSPNGADNWCCGGGGGLAVMDSREGVQAATRTFYEYRMEVGGRMKLGQVAKTGASYLAAPCSNCKRQLTQLMEYHKTGVSVGGVVDLLSRAIRVPGQKA